MFVMQKYADISTKNNNRGYYLKTTTAHSEIFMKRHRFRQASKVCEIPT